MTTGNGELGEADTAADHSDPFRALAERLPRPFRFLAVGGLGLITDLGVFTLVIAHWPHPLAARVVSLAFATLVTWRLNRALTFDRSGRQPADEAARYAAVAATAQGVSYAVFAALVLTVLARHPQAALLAGAMFGALFSYAGHRLFAFKPTTPSSSSAGPARQTA
jgi:putative flippase GtrA